MKALALLLSLLFIVSCSGIDVSNYRARLTVRKFSSCDEIRSYVKQVHEEYRASVPDTFGKPTAMANQASGADSGAVNLQEADIDEADRLRVGTSQIYFSRVDRIEVIQRSDLKLVGKFRMEGASRIEMFTEADRLIALASFPEAVEIKTYRVTQANQLPTLQSHARIEGKFSDARYVRGRLLLLLSGQMVSAEVNGYWLPRVGADVSGVACQQVAVPPVADIDFTYTKLVSLNPDDLAGDSKSMLMLGLSEMLYVGSENIYLGKQYVHWPTHLPAQLVLAKVHLEGDGALKYTAVGAVEGWAKDRWSLKEYVAKDALAVATTYTGEDFQTQNQLAVLTQAGEQLVQSGAVRDFGKREDIRAVRYVDNMAYVVTFEKTDPLFAIDMSDPLHPQMKSDLEVPGFSVYLHPAAQGRLLGLGFGATDMGGFSWFQGLQFSLFDVSNPLALRRLDNQELGTRGSYSDAAEDPHAFFFDAERQVAGFPLVEMAGGSFGDFGTEIKFSGAVLYSIGDKLTEKARFTHQAWISQTCKAQMAQPRWWRWQSGSLDINRLNRVDGKLLTFSVFGLKAYTLDGVELNAQAFESLPDSMTCPSTPQYW